MNIKCINEMIRTSAENENCPKIESTMAVYQLQTAELPHKNFNSFILCRKNCEGIPLRKQ